MASPSPAPARRAPRDRLGDLPDYLLGNILSYLPTKEAGSAAALSRRWRNIFCNVHAISFEEREGERAKDWYTFYHEAEERKSCSGAILDDVCSALLCRRRTAGTHVPLRSFRFAFDDCHHWNAVHVDQWLSYLLRTNRLHELHLDLCFWLGPICQRRRKNVDYGGEEEEEVDSGTDNSDAENEGRKWRTWSYVLPRGLFSCTAIRTLRISNCRMKLPRTVELPYVETLSITAPRRDGGRSVQRLISSCPRLVDLTLEAISRLRTVSVLDKRLRRLAIRCCHSLRSVHIDASELRSLDYCGAAPAESLLSLHGAAGIPSCTVNFCQVPYSEEGHHRFTRFMEKISAARHLHLHHQQLPYSCFEGFPSFSSLTRLALEGALPSPGAIRRILEQAPNLEILTLLMDLAGVPEAEGLMAADESSFAVPCLRRRVKEINMVHYQGEALQRVMARLLFRNALVLERMCVVLVKGPFALQYGLKKEIEGWMVARHVEKIFL